MTDFSKIYEKYSGDVYKFLFTLCKDEFLAEDLTAETFLKALTGIGKFRGDCSLYVWLCQIGKNLYYDHCKKQKNILPIKDEFVQGGDSPELSLITKEQVSNVLACLHKIDEPYKEVFMLHVFAEVSLVEISRIFGKSESWARVTFYRAKAQITEMLKRRNQYE